MFLDTQHLENLARDFITGVSESFTFEKELMPLCIEFGAFDGYRREAIGSAAAAGMRTATDAKPASKLCILSAIQL